MRYFLISYAYPSGFGTILIENQLGNFPSEGTIKTGAAGHSGTSLDGISILNIFEFKSKKDFTSYHNKK